MTNGPIDIWLVALSSSQEKRDPAEGYEVNVNSYLVKPMDFDEFDELVRTGGRLAATQPDPHE
jgi:DNA-binding response OmpR family regulator